MFRTVTYVHHMQVAKGSLYHYNFQVFAEMSGKEIKTLEFEGTRSAVLYLK